MAAVLHDEGKAPLLDAALVALGSDLRVMLYTNVITPDRTKTLSDYTAATFSGYGAVTPTFPTAALNALQDGESDASPATFTHNGGGTANTVLGWVLYLSSSNKVLFAANFSGGIYLAALGDYVAVTLPMILKAAA